MIIKGFHTQPHEWLLTTGQLRSGILIALRDDKGNQSWGEVSPLPKWSKESLEQATEQLCQQQNAILQINWTKQNCFQELTQLDLLPSVTFGLESALLALLDPLPEQAVEINASALLMGSREETLEQAMFRYQEGYRSAKVKVGHLSFQEAETIIHDLKDRFPLLRLRIDVNRAWKTADSLKFFSGFSLDAFDYVEEPFQNPQDLALFTHPLAIDESLAELSLEQIERFPKIKAIIYKPTIQGGMLSCMDLYDWTMKYGVSLILSSAFESELGLTHIASMAHRLALKEPIGIGTYHFLKDVHSKAVSTLQLQQNSLRR
jgi:o-succinylbenzoate synthase